MQWKLIIITCLTLLAVNSGLAQKMPEKEDWVILDRMTFLQGLKLNEPEFSGVKEALKKGDVNGAGKAYIAYFRNKKFVSPLLTRWDCLNRNPNYTHPWAEDCMKGILNDVYHVYKVPASGINWHDNPLLCISRFPFFPFLLMSAYHKQDSKYVRFATDIAYGYMGAYPIDSFVGKDLSTPANEIKVSPPWNWNQIPGRLGRWSNALVLMRKIPEITDEELLMMLERIHEESGYMLTQMQEWVNAGHNGGCDMITNMARTCALLEDFESTDERLNQVALMLEQFVKSAFYHDGVAKELTTAYWAEMAQEVQLVAYALLGRPEVSAIRERLIAIVTALAGLGKPTGGLIAYGDNCPGRWKNYVYRPLLKWLNLPWVETFMGHAEGPPPPFIDWPVPGQDQWSGYYSMRSDWSRVARFMAIDGGPWGTNHQHGDKLSMVVSAYGEDFIIDPTGTYYDSNRPGAYLSRQQAGFLHNTISVDGVDEFIRDGKRWPSNQIPCLTRKPLNNIWKQGTNYVLFAGSFSFDPIKPVKWERRIVFAGRRYWLLQDVFKGKQETAKIEQNFQFARDIKVQFLGSITIATAPNGARLVIKPLTGGLAPVLSVGDKGPHTTYWPNGVSHQTRWYLSDKPPMHGQGWVGRQNSLIPAPAVTYTGQVNLPAAITLAIIPLAPGQSIADIPKIKSVANDEQTIWLLPIGKKVLRFQTSEDNCSVSANRQTNGRRFRRSMRAYLNGVKVESHSFLR